MAGEVQQQLERIVRGDRSATAWLYDTFAPRLFHRLRQRYGYPGGLDAEDLLQDAFLFFFQHDYRVLRNFMERTPAPQKTPARLERHLWDMACGVATNRRRSSAHRKVVPFAPTDDISAEASAERGTIDRDLLDRLDACLEQSGERVYLYYKLRFHDGMAPEEIAATTGWSRKATYKLKQTLNKAVQACADQLDIRTSG